MRGQEAIANTRRFASAGGGSRDGSSQRMSSSEKDRRGQVRLPRWPAWLSRGIWRDRRGVARAPADYAPQALPERQPAIAALLPTSLAGLAGVAAALVVVVGTVLALGFHAPVLAALGRFAGPRFANSMAAVRDCIDPATASSLVGWLAQLQLLFAAMIAVVVKSMRRHRRGARQGRAPAWGAMACLLLVASLAAHMPLGRVVGTIFVEATGIAFGPAGFGWWVAVAATLLGTVSAWAVLSLHERVAVGSTLTAAWTAWAAAAAAAWLAPDERIHPGAAMAAWVAGCGFVVIAMLAAARSVIREARGEAGRPATPVKPGAQPAQAARPVVDADAASQEEDRGATPDWRTAAAAVSGYTDGSDVEDAHELRHLSKAERKRLRKLARMNRAA